MPYINDPSELGDPDRDLSHNPMEKWESRTVYFLGSFAGRGPGHALYEVKIEGGRVLGKSGELLVPVSKFFDRSNPEVPMAYLLGATRFGGPSKLYLLQHEGHSNWWIRESSTRSHDSYQGCIFDTMTKELMPFKRPNQIKKAALLISAYGKLYHLAYPSAYRSMSGMPDPSFEVYDPDTGFWSRLSTFPRYQMKWCDIDIIGYAVCYDCILISLGGHERSKFWVYQVTMDKWKEVNMPADRDSHCYYYSFKGRAVVVDNTIYALSSVGGVIAFSLMMEEMADGSVKYSVEKPLLLRGLYTCFHMDSECSGKTQYLVHLGGLNFSFLQTITRDATCQRVWITTFDIISSGGRRRIRTLGSTMRKVDNKGLGRFYLESGFALECEDLEPKGKGIVTTSSMMQPTDAPRLHKLEKATLKKIKRQIYKQKRKMLKLGSKRVTMIRKLFRPCQKPKYGYTQEDEEADSETEVEEHEV